MTLSIVDLRVIGGEGLRGLGILNSEDHGQWAFESTPFEGYILQK